MSKIDDIWSSMNEDVPKHQINFNDLNKKKEKKEEREKKEKKSIKATKKVSESSNVIQAGADRNQKDKESLPAVPLTFDEMKQKISADLANINEENPVIRRNSLSSLFEILFTRYTSTDEIYSSIFSDICRPLFKRYTDSTEKCREYAYKITQQFFEKSCNIVPILPYYFPALLQRIAEKGFFDDDMKVFVNDVESHEAYKRGKAVDRQDKVGVIDVAKVTVIEPAEEIRLLACEGLLSLINSVLRVGATPVLHPYFEDMILFLQAQVRDPFPDLKATACRALELLASIDDFEVGMRFFSVGIVRALLPCLRHRHIKVRLAALKSLHKCLIVPDRSKRKASGSDAILDLVGFREENILPIAAFYKTDIQINYLAELVSDPSQSVREELVKFLVSLLTVIEDRYDHQTRLLPYLLDLMTDESSSVAQAALACLTVCGKQYEDDHREEILEKRQYGVDGDLRINLEKPLPQPFKERPSLGIRLYVRGNTKRFLVALINELTNWMAPTRLKSANLLKIIVILCEEHLTMEIHTILPLLVKAIKFSRDDGDQNLTTALIEVAELLGRYILPEVYVYYLLPRLRGDPDVQPLGIDADQKITILIFLQSLISGSKSSQVIPYLDELISVLTDPFVISFDSVTLQSFALSAVKSILLGFKDKSNSVIESFYLSSGRLHSLNIIIRKILAYILIQASNSAHIEVCTEIIDLVAKIENNVDSSEQRIRALFEKHLPIILQETLPKYSIDSDWLPKIPEHCLLLKILECPYAILSNPRNLSLKVSLEHFFIEKFTELRQPSHASEISLNILQGVTDLLVTFLVPFCSGDYQGRPENAVFNKYIYNSEFNRFQPFRSGDLSFQEVQQIFILLITENKFSFSPSLHLSRLFILSLLCRVEFPLPHELPSLKIAEAHEELINYFSAISNKSSECEIVQSANLLTLFDSVGNHILPAALSPSSAIAVRFTTIKIFRNLSTKIRNHFNISKLKSFAYWSTLDYSVHKEYFDSLQTLLSTKEKFLPHFAAILKCLSDESDTIREESLSFMNENANFILSDEEWQNLKAERGWTNERPSFTPIVNSLLQCLTLEIQSMSSCINSIDQTLRVLCVLSPTHFESLLRKRWSIDQLQKENYEVLNEYMNGLINHADLIASFQ